MESTLLNPNVTGTPTDPWQILGGLGSISGSDLATQGGGTLVVLSIYNLLRSIGIIGILVTLIIMLIKFTTGNANVRAEAKSMFSKKLVLLFFIFTSAYFFGWALSLIANI